MSGPQLYTEEFPVHIYRAVTLDDARIVEMQVKYWKDAHPLLSPPDDIGRGRDIWVFRNEIEARVCCRKGDVLRVPASWWDHLIRDVFPAWWKRRWPPKMLDFHARAYIPDLPLPPGAHYGRIAWFDSETLRDIEVR